MIWKAIDACLQLANQKVKLLKGDAKTRPFATYKKGDQKFLGLPVNFYEAMPCEAMNHLIRLALSNGMQIVE